jgi:MYND finger
MASTLDSSRKTIWTCANCGNQGSDLLRCSRCNNVHYCNKECQKTHWKTHKPICNDYVDNLKRANAADVDEVYRKWKDRNNAALLKLAVSIEPRIADKKADHFIMIKLEYKPENPIETKFQIISYKLMSLRDAKSEILPVNPVVFSGLADGMKQALQALDDQLLCTIMFLCDGFGRAIRVAPMPIPIGATPSMLAGMGERDTAFLVSTINRGLLAMSKDNKDKFKQFLKTKYTEK